MLKRNPFKYIGKVYKYECKNIARTLIPLFVILLIMGVVLGFLQSPLSSYTKEISNDEIMKSIVVIVLTAMFVLYIFAVFVVTLVLLSSRFKKSMTGDEAYLNLVLPVTMAEHIWGRFLAALTWIFLCFVTTVISSGFLMIKNEALEWFPELIDAVRETGFEVIGMTPVQFFTMHSLIIFVEVITIVLLIYCVNSLGHLAQKNKTIVKLISVIGLFYVFLNLPGRIKGFMGEEISYLTGLLVILFTHLFLCIVFMITTQLVFKKRLNLE